MKRTSELRDRINHAKSQVAASITITNIFAVALMGYAILSVVNDGLGVEAWVETQTGGVLTTELYVGSFLVAGAWLFGRHAESHWLKIIGAWWGIHTLLSIWFVVDTNALSGNFIAIYAAFLLLIWRGGEHGRDC